MRRVGIPELGRMEAHLKELQAENAELTEAWNTQGKVLIERKRGIAKLEAVVDAAKAVGEERGIHRYYKPMDVAIDAMLDAIKEVK
jgi:D-alanyl-D-alanine dipeptidase